MGEGAVKAVHETPTQRKAFSPLAMTKSLKKKRSTVAKIRRGDIMPAHPEDLDELNDKIRAFE